MYKQFTPIVHAMPRINHVRTMYISEYGHIIKTTYITNTIAPDLAMTNNGKLMHNTKVIPHHLMVS